jgi:hypothetical protein
LPEKTHDSSGPKNRERCARTVTYVSAIVQMLSSANAYPTPNPRSWIDCALMCGTPYFVRVICAS